MSLMSRSGYLMLILLMLAMARNATAQVIYLPIEYQYHVDGRSFYYGGNNPAVFQAARFLSGESDWGASGGFVFHSANLRTHREVATERSLVYTDQWPRDDARVWLHRCRCAERGLCGCAALFRQTRSACRRRGVRRRADDFTADPADRADKSRDARARNNTGANAQRRARPRAGSGHPARQNHSSDAVR